jgi:hypothetical protein
VANISCILRRPKSTKLGLNKITVYAGFIAKTEDVIR